MSAERLKTVIAMLLRSGCADFNSLWLSARMYEQIGEDEESRAKVRDAINALVAEKRIAVVTVSGAVVYTSPDKVTFEKVRTWPKNANDTWRDAIARNK